MRVPRPAKSMAAAAAIAAAASVGMAGNANAGAIAYAELLISNFAISSSNPAALTPLGATNNGSSGASLTGFTGVFDSESLSALPLGSGNGSIDPGLSCLGDCAGIGQNQFAQTAFPPTVNHFSRGDSQLVQGTPGAANEITRVDLANANAETSIQNLGAGNGEGVGNVGNTAQFTINVSGLTTFDFSFDAQRRIYAQVDGPPTQSGNAFATTNYSITVTDQTTGQLVFNWQPGITGPGSFNLNQQVSLDSAGLSFFDDSGSFSNTLNLGPGNYSFTISHGARTTASANVGQQVPEPSTLALLGFGLIGGGLLLYGRWRKPDEVA